MFLLARCYSLYCWIFPTFSDIFSSADLHHRRKSHEIEDKILNIDESWPSTPREKPPTARPKSSRKRLKSSRKKREEHDLQQSYSAVGMFPLYFQCQRHWNLFRDGTDNPLFPFYTHAHANTHTHTHRLNLFPLLTWMY